MAVLLRRQKRRRRDLDFGPGSEPPFRVHAVHAQRAATSVSLASPADRGKVRIRLEGRQWQYHHPSKASLTTLLLGRVQPAAFLPTACRPIPQNACYCWKRVGRTTGSGFTSRSDISLPSATRAPIGC